jgi:hypothetical protein
MNSRIALLLSLALVLALGATAWADDSKIEGTVCGDGNQRLDGDWNTDFTALYGTPPAGCSTCHDGVPALNDYGADATAAAGATRTAKMQAIEGDDSDGDGVSNIDEINAGFNPGDSGDTPPVAAYVGSAACMGCHNPIHTSWMTTLHSSIYMEPDPANLLPPVWSSVVSVEDASRSLGPIYVQLTETGLASPEQDFNATIYQDEGLTQLIAGPMQVVRFHGGRVIAENANNDPRNTAGGTRGIRRSGEYYPGEGPVLGKQRYQVMIGGQHFILPIQWNPLSDIDDNRQGWVEYHLRDWIDSGFNLVIGPNNSEERRCAGCHQTGIEEVTFNAGAAAFVPGTSHEILGAFELVSSGVIEENIGCEACHGPASLHTSGGFTGAPGSREIVQPNLNLDVDQRVDACGFCHSRGNSAGTVNGTTLGYPYRDATPHRPIPGDVWGDFYVEAGGYWIDTPELRVARQHHQQYEEFVLSNHFNFPFHRVYCSECHNSHGTDNEHDIVTSVNNSVSGEVAVTGARGVGEGNLCVGCHYSHGPFDNTLENVDFERHYWHPPDGTHGSPDCTNCHMPAMAISGVGYDIHTHSFHAVLPEETIASQVPNSCMVMCHTGPYSTSYIPGGGPSSSPILDWTQPVDVEISEWIMEVMPSSTMLANYFIASPEELVHLVHEEPYMAPAMDVNADTEATTGTDASPFVIDAADLVTFVEHGR